MNFLEEMARLDDEWRTRRRRIDSLISDSCLTNGAFLTGYKIAYYHALAHDSAEFQASYQKSMEEMMYLHSRVCMQAQAVAELHLHRDHSDPATWQAYPGDAAPLIRDLQNLIEQLRVHAAALRPNVPKKHHPAMDEPFERFSTLALSLVEALKEASAFAGEIECLQTRGEPIEKAVKTGYKQTEVGVIPEEWEVARVVELVTTGPKNGYSGRSGKEARGTSTLSLGATTTGSMVLNGETVKRLEETIPKNSDLYLKPGDVLVQRSNTPDLVGTTAIFDGPREMYVYPDLMMRMRFRDDATAHFFWRYANSTSGRRFFASIAAGSSGSMPKINGEKLRKMSLPQPPIAEQRAIATALSDVDGLLGGLDRLIAKKRDLKQAAMQQLLTGQSRLSGFMVKSGYKKTDVGIIPEDWELKALAEIADKIMVGIASAATHAYRTKGIPMFRNQNIKVGHLDDGDLLFIAPEYEVVFKNKRLREGDLLTMRTGYPGVTAIVPLQYESAQSFTTLITRPRQHEAVSSYLCHYINSKMGQRFFTQSRIGGAQKNVNAGTLRHMPVPLPKVPEQIAIAEVLTEMDLELVGLEQRREKTRALKQAMMQELLTGRTRLV